MVDHPKVEPTSSSRCRIDDLIGRAAGCAPAPNRPIGPMNSINCQTVGRRSPIHTIAWISTPHSRHAHHRSRSRLHVVGAMLALGAMAKVTTDPKDPRQHLPTDEEADGEVHERRGDAAERDEHQAAQQGDQDVAAARTDGRSPGPALAVDGGGGHRRSGHQARHRAGAHRGERLRCGHCQRSPAAPRRFRPAVRVRHAGKA